MKEEVQIKGLLDEFKHESESLRSDLDHFRPTSNSTSTIQVNAGGIGVWLAVTCCLLAVLAVVFMSLVVLDQRREIDDLNHHLTAIYMLAPHLRPDEDSE